ncbi:hypothetical protein HZS61_000796 [Fusarium oxysporum f. sp. conglutinans]|nr:hypothetical protein FOVG_01107 [Fusarium oxysporum f. sp. pisi HDV247]KAF6529484.1 hypothetical protein HZS61_000796 [Fusarium oxysporum f. sp. conglutinans]KAG6992444.1 hypothetical protein FocnCong_v018794 [Fusarium oxysporum f. sp. conglutinans]KAG7438938.1 hypothetical protein Forpi1262_v001105 [Fusarium oxysporum f. sp. raphani]SCO79743.1 uncharacterized protein FRV6_03956 [Fusarium oxysporum]
MSPNGARSSPGLPSQRRHDESWVEVASQPSSSSLSSIGDEIVTTGLRVGNPYVRRRRLQQSARSLPQQQTAIHNVNAADLSSQEEYDESDSEDDRLLTSSTENAQRSEEEADMDSEAESDGDNVTALGRVSDQPTEPVFRPQPNAFTHPSTQRRDSAPAIPSAPPPPHPHNGLTRPSFTQRSQTRPHRAGPSFMSPAVREENDAALRASLTTLLSCAHAARGLPKSKEEAEAQRTANAGVGPSSQPMELRFVPESELSTEPRRAQRPAGPSPPRKRGSPARSPSRTSERGKHGSGSPTAPRATKKKKVAQMEEPTSISPTLLTWVVSAGVVVLVSVVGFGAGYVIGREVGKQEALAASVGSVNETASCGQEVIRSSGNGLRKLRWGAVGKSIVA